MTFSPIDLSPKLWLKSNVGLYQDSAGTNAVTSNAQSVGLWKDQSGNSIDLSDGGYTTYKPSYQSNQINGFPSIRFNNQKLLSNVGGPFTEANVSFFIVYRRNSRSSYPVFNFRNDPSSFNGADFFYNDGFARPNIGLSGRDLFSNIGFPLSTFVAVAALTTSNSVQYIINERTSKLFTTSTQTVSQQGIELGYSFVPCDFDVAELIYVDRVANSTEISNCMNYLMDKYNVSTPSRSSVMVFSGNSITLGHTSHYQPYTDKAASDAGVSSFDCYNCGLSGASTVDLQNLYSTTIAPLYIQNYTNILSIWEGTNHLSINATALEAQNAIQSYCLLARSNGWKVIVGTIIDRNSLFTNGQTISGFRASAATVNSWLRANYTSFADYLADPALNVNLQDASNTTYFADGTHLTQNGHDEVAISFEAAIASFPTIYNNIGSGTILASPLAKTYFIYSNKFNDGIFANGAIADTIYVAPKVYFVYPQGGIVIDGNVSQKIIIKNKPLFQIKECYSLGKRNVSIKIFIRDALVPAITSCSIRNLYHFKAENRS